MYQKESILCLFAEFLMTYNSFTIYDIYVYIYNMTTQNMSKV